MRAAYIEAHGRPEYQVRHSSDPVPGPSDVLVEVDAIAVDNVDTFVVVRRLRDAGAVPVRHRS